VLALSKTDLVDAQRSAAIREQWQARLGPEVPIIATSSVTGAGLQELTADLIHRVPAADQPGALQGTGVELGGERAEHRVYRPAAERGYSVRRTGERRFAVTGAGVERLLARYDLDNEEALAHLERRLRGIGVIRALETEGFEAGDDVEIAGVAFDLDPSS
jgi:GTP-binding protein